MYPLRLRSHLVLEWGGRRYVRGRIYEAGSQAEYRAMTGSGAFVPAEPMPMRSPAEIAAAQAARLEVVAVRDAGLGDTLIALPYVQEFGRLNPRVHVSYAVDSRYVELIAAQPGLHRVYDLAAGRPFAREIDLCGYVERARGARTIPRSRLFGEAFGIDRRLPPAPLMLRASWTLQARERLQAAGWTPAQPIASLTARGTVSRRSYAETLTHQAGELLEAAGVFVAWTDLDVSRETFRGVSFGGHLSVAELAGILSVANVIVGPDTGVLHLGAHLGKPLVGIFTDWPARLRLDSYNAFAFEPRELPCAPCFDRGCPPETCTLSANPREVAAAAIACLRPRWNLLKPVGGEGFRARASVFGDPRTRA